MLINSIQINGCLPAKSLKKIPKKNLQFADVIHILKVQKDIKFIYEINLNLDKVKIDKINLSDALLHIIRANIKIDILYSNNLGEGCFLKETLPIVLRSKELNSIDNISILTINLEKNNDSLIMFFSICIIGENSSCISNFKYTNVKSTSIIETTKVLPYDSTLDFL